MRLTSVRQRALEGESEEPKHLADNGKHLGCSQMTAVVSIIADLYNLYTSVIEVDSPTSGGCVRLTLKAVRCLEADLEELLSFQGCPQGHRRNMRTTDAIERAFRGVRRRTRAVRYFQNTAGVDRIIHGVITHCLIRVL